MAQIPLLPGGFYHVYNRGNNRENLFREERNYYHFLRLYVKHVEPVAATYAYCLLPNHFHLLIRVRTEGEQVGYQQETYDVGKENLVGRRAVGLRARDPSRQFSNLFNAYTKAVNRAYERTGKLFEGRFRRKPVEDGCYFVTLVRYIHQNPQRHGLVDDFRDWPFSSYGAVLSDRPTRVQRQTVLDWFEGRAGFLEAHEWAVDETAVEELLFD